MRNFSRGYKNDSGSNFSRGDRRNDRDSRYQTNNAYKRPADKGFNRSFSDRNTTRRDYDNNTNRSYNQERRDNHIGNRSYGGRPFQEERGFRNEKNDRYRNQTPPRSRDREGHSATRFNRPNDTRIRQRPVSPSNFRNRNDFQSISARPTRPVRRTIGSGPPRSLRRNDLRSSLILKRTAPTNRSKEYIKKIKQARLKLSEVSKAKTNDEPKTPPKESKEHDDEDDFLDVANDVVFDEDVETVGKNSTVNTEENGHTSKEHVKSEVKNESIEKLNTSGASEERNRKDREKSLSRDNDTLDGASSSIDLTCVQCSTKCSSILDFRNHLTRRIHLMAMKKVSIKVRITLNRLRKVQRDRQLEIEARLKNVERIPSKYCQICKLYFRQSKIEHRDSEDHKKIRNFLKPYCKLCHVQLLSAMKYEIHKCTINHLKMKGNKNETAGDVDFQELDLGDFKTVDSIGDVDGLEMDSDDDVNLISKDSVAVGQEFVNKVEVNYCSLCRDYIPLLRTSKDEKAVADHCKSKKHLKWYYQSKKKDEIELTQTKTKSEGDPMEEDEEGEPSKKLTSSDKDESNMPAAKKNKANENSDDSKKFKRYFEVAANNAENDD